MLVRISGWKFGGEEGGNSSGENIGGGGNALCWPFCAIFTDSFKSARTRIKKNEIERYVDIEWGSLRASSAK